MGKRDADGYISIIGRSKDLIITGGLNVYPKEIEEVIDAMPGVVESAVVGVPHPDFGEAVIAAVVRQNNERVRGALDRSRDHQGTERRPCQLQGAEAHPFCRRSPRNTMGKVQKNMLRLAIRLNRHPCTPFNLQ